MLKGRGGKGGREKEEKWKRSGVCQLNRRFAMSLVDYFLAQVRVLTRKRERERKWVSKWVRGKKTGGESGKGRKSDSLDAAAEFYRLSSCFFLMFFPSCIGRMFLSVYIYTVVCDFILTNGTPRFRAGIPRWVFFDSVYSTASRVLSTRVVRHSTLDAWRCGLCSRLKFNSSSKPWLYVSSAAVIGWHLSLSSQALVPARTTSV